MVKLGQVHIILLIKSKIKCYIDLSCSNIAYHLRNL